MQINTTLFVLCSLLIWSWLQPLHLLPWMSLHSEVLAFIAILAATANSLFSGKYKKKILLPRLAIWVVLFSLVVVVQYAFGKIQYFGDLIVYLLYLSAALLALLIGGNSDRSDELLDVMSFVVLIGGSITVIILLLQVLGMDVDSQYVNPMPQLRRPGGNMGQPNHAATLFVMAIAGVCYLGVRRYLSALLVTLFLFVLILGLAITESRSGLISLLLMSIFGVIKLLIDKRRSAVVYVLLFIGVQQLFWWLWPLFFFWFWGLSVGDAGGINRLSAMGGNLRLIMWGEIFDAASQKPWVGWGWGQLPKALNATVDQYAISAPFTYSHNIIIDIMVAFGIPVAALCCYGIARFCYSLLRNSRNFFVFWGGALVFPIGIHSLLEFPYAYAYFLIPACVLLGRIQGEFGSAVSIGIQQRVLVVIVCCTSALALWVMWDYIALEEDFRVARFESMRIGAPPSGYTPPQALVLTQLKSMALAARIQPSSKMNEESILELREVALRFPYTGFQNRYALALALNNRADESLRQLKVIRVMQGEQTYSDLEGLWRELASTEYPQLEEVVGKAF